MNEKPRVLILSSAYLPLIGGSELAIKNITDRLSDFDFDLITTRLNKNSSREEKNGNISIYRVGGAVSLFKFLLPKNFFPVKVFLKARSLVKENNYIAVHAFQASAAAGGGWLLKLFYPQLPFILTLQEGEKLENQSTLIKLFRRVIIKKADAITAISNYLKNYIFNIRTDMMVKVIPNGVDIEAFSRQPSYGEMTNLETKLGIKPDDKVIITVSRLVPKNGVDLLIEALGVLVNGYQQQAISLKLLIVGDGPMKKNLESRIKNYGLEKNVIFNGEVRNEELPLFLKISDVFVRPSRSEGLGIAFLEAMAAGVPIIGTKVGGIPDFLEDRKTGLFCLPEPKDIAFKIRVIVENDKLRQEMVENARNLVKEKYDWEIIAERFRALYRRYE